MRGIRRCLPILLGLLVDNVAAQQLPLRDGAFGFVNSDGSEIIALGSLSTPTTIRAALCSRGSVFRVSYARRQIATPADNSRQVAANFANQAGDVFRVVGGPARADETCYLSADSDLVAGAVPVSAPAGRGCDAARLRHASDAKHRAVLHCWPLGSAAPDVEILALQFAVIDTSALASVVVAHQDDLFFRDLPATYRGPDADVWRVEDNGIFSPESLGFPFFCRLRGTYLFALTWAGAEGEDSYLLAADSADAFRAVTTSYRYWVPN